MSWNSNDYNGVTNASEERDYYERAAAREDARDAAEALEMSENDEAEEREALLFAAAAAPAKFTRAQVLTMAAAQGIALDPAARHIPLDALEALGLDREWSKYVRIERRAA